MKGINREYYCKCHTGTDNGLCRRFGKGMNYMERPSKYYKPFKRKCDNK